MPADFCAESGTDVQGVLVAPKGYGCSPVAPSAWFCDSQEHVGAWCSEQVAVFYQGCGLREQGDVCCMPAPGTLAVLGQALTCKEC